jgi:tripartite-type tricarboxylate transporter receptor subunit TctC
MKYRFIFAALLGISFSVTARADDAYPSRVVRVIVPYTAGGITDVLARLVADGLSRSLGQRFIVENRPGGATSIGTRAVIEAAPDGYTLLMGTTVLSINPHLVPNLPYDASKDLVPIANVGEAIGLIAVPPSTPAKTLAELVALEKSKPGAMSYGSAGNGSIGHIAGELFNQLAGTRFAHVAYRGSAPLMTDAIGGHIPVIIDVVITAIPAIQAGTLRPLALLQNRRSDLLPDVPTSQEAGFPDLVSPSYFGYFAPRGTPQAIVSRLNTEINMILSQPEVQEKIKAQGAVLTGGSSEDFAKLIADTTRRYGDVIRQANITVNKM